MLKKIFSTSILLALFALVPSPAKESLDLPDRTLPLIQAVLEGAAKTIGKKAKAKEIKWEWCEGVSHYKIKWGFICLSKKEVRKLLEIGGDAAVAFLVAHEYAHHVQYSQPQLLAKHESNTNITGHNILRLELQADCFAGVILASIPNISFNQSDVEGVINAAIALGDREYYHYNHHGSGENRMLAVSSGLIYGSSKGKNKDAYYKMYCLNSEG